MNVLRKAVSLGSGGGSAPSFTNPQDIRYQSPLYPGPDAYYLQLDTATPWIRLWIDPSVYWPNGTGGPDPSVQGAIDQQIAYAKYWALQAQWGFKVVLTVLPYWPSWINGSSNLHDMPKDVTPSGPWAYFVYYLAARYNPYNPNRPQNGFSWVDVLEPFNEPNNTSLTTRQDDSPERTADMMKAAKQVILSTNNTPVLAGPAVLDQEVNDAVQDYRSFTARVLVQLEANGFYGLGNNQSFIWSVHNYADVTYDIGIGSTYSSSPDYTLTRTGQVYDLLQSTGWRGWPDGGLTPYIFATEGGVTLGDIHSKWGITTSPADLNQQSKLWQNNWSRMKTATEGRGVGMVTNYTYYPDPRPIYDSALLAGPGAPRPVYSTWKSFASAV